jgi:caa(3)-type oxidase subunit IV
MTDNADTNDHPVHPVQPYLVVGGALAVFTIVSFVVNVFVRGESLSAMAGLAIILGVAVVKATLVAIYFMHLKYDWVKVGFMIVPALILGTMFFFVLMPDIVLAWH